MKFYDTLIGKEQQVDGNNTEQSIRPKIKSVIKTRAAYFTTSIYMILCLKKY